MAGVVCPHGANQAGGVARGEHRQTVIHWPGALKAEPGPTAVIQHAPVAAEAHSPLRPVQFHRLPIIQRRKHGRLHLPGCEVGVVGHVLLLRGVHATGPEYGRIAGEVGSVVRVRGGHHEALAQDAVLHQAPGQPSCDSSRHAAVVNGHHGDGVFAADDHRPSPELAIYALVLRTATAVAGQHHGTLRRHLGFRNAHRA